VLRVHVNVNVINGHSTYVLSCWVRLLVKWFSSEILLHVEQGHLHMYRFCDNVWTFLLENASFKTNNEVTVVDRVKIVACDAKILAH
jgi:hypothetical protein